MSDVPPAMRAHIRELERAVRAGGGDTTDYNLPETFEQALQVIRLLRERLERIHARRTYFTTPGEDFY